MPFLVDESEGITVSDFKSIRPCYWVRFWFMFGGLSVSMLS